MKFISWNVNGFKSCLDKGFKKFFDKTNADFFCIQETKLAEKLNDFKPKNYESYFSFSDKKGYSGTAIFTQHEPLSVKYGMGIPEFDSEGRLIILEYDNFYLINVYTPNSKSGLVREDFRDDWEENFKEYLKKLNNIKPLVVCGDFNATHLEIDSKIPRSSKFKGFSESDRVNFCELIEYVGLKDTFRILYPHQKDIYTWWSYSRNSRNENTGARIDYFLISEYLYSNLKSADIYSDVSGSDHCPIGMELDL